MALGSSKKKYNNKNEEIKKRETSGLSKYISEPANSFHPLIFLPNGHSLCKRH